MERVHRQLQSGQQLVLPHRADYFLTSICTGGYLVSNVTQPIGIFDSGIGGLSVLRHIREQLPAEDLRYFADSAFAPYGEKPEEAIIERTLDIASYLLGYYRCKALVVACNTATAAAVHILREQFPGTPIIGIEPGLKPAASITRSQVVGVLATERTLQSSKFNLLQEELGSLTGVRFIMQACPGLADIVEKKELYSERTSELVRSYLLPLIEQDADTIVLGCTHYPFLQHVFEKTISESTSRTVHIVDTGIAVTRQLARVLEMQNLKNTHGSPQPGVYAMTTGDTFMLERQFEHLLNIRPAVAGVASALRRTAL